MQVVASARSDRMVREVRGEVLAALRVAAAMLLALVVAVLTVRSVGGPWWGWAIVGATAGEVVDEVRYLVITWRDWRSVTTCPTCRSAASALARSADRWDHCLDRRHRPDRAAGAA